MIAPGTIIGGDFRIVEPLSEGGMGAVFIAEQISTGRRRALKLMKRELVADAQLRARFALEANAGAKIASEHVVEVLAAGVTDEGQPWLAMELLSGDSLHDVVTKRGALDLVEAQTIMAHICHAIAAAHRVGIVHRDLKPENVFVANRQREGATFMAKVLDFGIAKVVAESQSAAFSQTAAIGTPMWMAPEQADPRGAITPSTDLWPLGLIGFFMLTGKPYWLVAHTNASLAALVREIAIEPLASASARAAELGVTSRMPTGFDEWFARCVHRNPKQRFASADTAKDAFSTLRAAGFAASPAGQSPLARSAPIRDADAFAPTGAIASPTPGVSAIPAIPATAAAARPAPVGTRRRPTALPWLLGGGSLFVVAVVVGLIGWRLGTAKQPDGFHRVGEREVAALLQRAKMDVPATGPGAGDLLRLETTDAWWGAQLPLVTFVFFCSLTDPTCAVTSRELDALTADEGLHAQVRFRHAVRTGDASARLAAEAAQGAFETGGTRAFMQYRDLVFAHRESVTMDVVAEWAKQIGVHDAGDYVIRLKRGEWKARVDADVAAYAAARIGSPGFVWANCDPLGLTVGYGASTLRDKAARFLADSPDGTLHLGATYIARCKPSRSRMLALADVEVSPFAAVGSAEWAKKIALAWATSLSTRDAAALTKTYAPRVVVGNKELSAADVVSVKRARFAKEPQLRSAVGGSLEVTAKGNGYVVELTRVERSPSIATATRTMLGIRATPQGWMIGEETDAEDASCAAAIVTAVLDVGEQDAAGAGDAGAPDGLTVVEHELDGSRAKVTVRKLVDGRSVASRDFVWDLSMPSERATSDAAPGLPPKRMAMVQRACPAK